jgi:probable HAF family extracellular repeat protein
MNRNHIQRSGCVFLGSVVLTGCLALSASAASFQGLGDLPGGTFFSIARAVSANSNVVVGYSTSASGTETFRWTVSQGMIGLGDLPGGSFSGSS